MTPGAGSQRDAEERTREDSVREAAERFRAACVQGGLQSPEFAKFPRGSCGITSEMLGQYLLDCGLGDWGYVTGLRHEPFGSHAWIEQSGLFVDITGDQFAGTPAVVVSRRALWTGVFEAGPSTRRADMNYYLRSRSRQDAHADYQELRRRVATQF